MFLIEEFQEFKKADMECGYDLRGRGLEFLRDLFSIFLREKKQKKGLTSERVLDLIEGFGGDEEDILAV